MVYLATDLVQFYAKRRTENSLDIQLIRNYALPLVMHHLINQAPAIKRKIILTDKPSAGLKIDHAAVTKEMEEEKLLAEILADFEDLSKSDA